MIKETVQEFYDAYPFPGRPGAYGPWEQLAPRLLELLDLPPDALRGKRVLDAGCGTGEYARSFANCGADVVAVDYSRGALQVARSLSQELGIHSIDFRRVDLLDPPDLGEFDFIFSLGVLHHTADPYRGFCNLRRRLRPGGYLVIGLYSSISRVHILALRRFLRIASFGNRERAINLAQRWFRGILPRFIGRENVDDRARIADLLAHPNEKPVSLHTSVDWFRKNDLDLLGCAPSADLKDYPTIRRLVGGRPGALAYVLMQLRWLRWNADYYLIGGRG